MGFKQPRVPEYQRGESVETYIRTLILFLKDFCLETWTQSRTHGKGIDETRRDINGISYPVTSVNGKTGDVKLEKADVGALGAQDTARDSEKIDGKTWAQILDALFPVGCIYLSVEGTSPAARFGGVWERIENRFLLGAGTSYAAGKTGGEAAHKLVISEIPSHAGHLYGNAGGLNGIGDAKGAWLGSVTVNTSHTIAYGWNYKNNEYYPINRSLGGNGTHNNMPPYLAVYMWKRVS